MRAAQLVRAARSGASGCVRLGTRLCRAGPGRAGTGEGGWGWGVGGLAERTYPSCARAAGVSIYTLQRISHNISTYVPAIDLEIGDSRLMETEDVHNRIQLHRVRLASCTKRSLSLGRRAHRALCASAKRRQMITPRPSRLMAPPRLSSPARAGPPRASPRPPRVSPPPPAPRPPPQCTRRRPCRGR